MVGEVVVEGVGAVAEHSKGIRPPCLVALYSVLGVQRTTVAPGPCCAADIQFRNNYALGILISLIVLAFGLALVVFIVDPDIIIPEPTLRFLVVS